MEKIYTSFEDFVNTLPNEDAINNITFVEQSSAVISGIGGSGDKYEGNIYSAPVTAPDFDLNLKDAIDFEKGYEIHVDDEGNVTSFDYNIDENGRVSKKGRDAKRVFYYYFGSVMNKPTKAEVDDLTKSVR